MSIAARVSSAEVTSQITERFVGKSCEARLVNSIGTDYTPGVTDDTVFLDSEIAIGTGGYQRQLITFAPADVSAFTDGGVGLDQKATIFTHDGGASSMDFTHVALVWSDGNPSSLGPVTSAPALGTDGTYTNIPVSFSDQAGDGMTIDLIVINDGVAVTDYAVSINKPGYGYVPGEVVTVTNAVLAGIFTADPGDLVFTVADTSANTEAGNIIAVAKPTSAVTVVAGNEAIFYWNVKLFNFFS